MCPLVKTCVIGKYLWTVVNDNVACVWNGSDICVMSNADTGQANVLGMVILHLVHHTRYAEASIGQKMGNSG